MKNFFNKTNTFYIISALLYLALGLVCVIIPAQITTAIPYIIGSVLIVNGALRLIGYFTNQKTLAFGFTVYGLAEGILDILLAIIIFINASISLVVIAVIIGIWALISGIVNINYAINKATNKQECILNFVFAVVQIVIGIILFFNFKGGITVSIVIVGIYLLFLCVSLILTKVILLNKFNEVKTKVEHAIDPTHVVINSKKNNAQTAQIENQQEASTSTQLNKDTNKPSSKANTNSKKEQTPSSNKKINSTQEKQSTQTPSSNKKTNTSKQQKDQATKTNQSETKNKNQSNSKKRAPTQSKKSSSN